MKQNIFLKFTSILLCLQILFSASAPAIIYARDALDSEGGGSESTPTEPQPTQESPAPTEAPAGTDEPVSATQAVGLAIDSAPPAQIAVSSVPQESTLTTETTTTQAVPPAQGEPIPTGTPTPANTGGTQLTGEQQQAAANTSATTSQAEDTSEHYQQQAVASPIVNSTTQATVLANYSQAANTVANATDAPTQTEREDSLGSPTLPTQLIAGLEQTNSQIPQVAGAVVSTVASVSEAVIGNVEGTLEVREQQALETRATEVEEEADAAQKQQQRTLDDYLNLTPQERAAKAAEILGLPANTPPSQIVSQLDQIGQNSGVQLSGSLDNLTLTQDKSDEQKRFEENFPATLDQSLQTDQGLEQVNKNLDTLLGQTASLASAGLSDLLGKGVESLKGDLPRLQELRQSAGFDQTSRFDIQDIQKYARLTQEELDQLKQGQIVNGIVPEEASKVQAKYEYAKALKEWQAKNEELQQEAKISAALFYGGGLVAEGATTVAAKVAKPFLGRATEAISGLFGGIFRRSAPETAEAGIRTALRDGEPVFAQTLAQTGNTINAIGTKESIGYLPLTPLTYHTTETLERTSELWAQTFGKLGPVPPEEFEAQKQVLAEWISDGKTESQITAAFNNAAATFKEYWTKGEAGSSESTLNAIRAWQYNSRLEYPIPIDELNRSQPKFILDITDSLLLKEKKDPYLNKQIEKALDGLVALRRYAVNNGADKSSFTQILEATNPDKIHLVTPDVIKSNFPPGEAENVAGLYLGKNKNILVSQQFSVDSVVLHECIHSACGLTTRDAGQRAEALNYQLGGTENRKKLTEGLTEWATLKSYELRGLQPDFESGYGQQVTAIEKVIQKLQEGGHVLNKGLTRPEAEAKVVEAAVSGYYGKLYEPLGKGNAQKGQQILREILDSTPDTKSNVIGAKLPEVVPEKIQIITPKEKAIVMAGGLITYGAVEYAIGKAVYNKLHPQNPEGPKQLPFNFNIAKQAHAQAESGNITVNKKQVLDNLLRANLARATIKKDGFVSGELIQDIIKKDLVDQSVIQTLGGYLISTGQNGTANGNIEPGHYKVIIQNFKEVYLSAPETIVIKNGKKVLEVGVSEGTTNQKTRRHDKTSFLNINAYADNQKGTAISVVTYYDQNGNGKWDSNEHAVPWAGVQVELKKVNQDKLVKFNAGWNLFTLTAVPEKPLTASSLIQEIAKQEGYATSVSTLVDGAWKTYVVRGDKDFSGDDFPIEPGKAYFVKNIKKSIFIFKGQEFVAPLIAKLTSGWNAVGVPKTSAGHKIGDLLDSARPLSAEGYEGAQWKSGLWDSYVKSSSAKATGGQAEQYGENFAIEPNRGYIIKVKSDTELNP